MILLFLECSQSIDCVSNNCVVLGKAISARISQSVQSLSHVWLFVTPWTAVLQAFLSITNLQSLLKLMSVVLVMSSNHLILCRPLLLPPSIYPIIRVFSNELVLHIRWPKYWSLFQHQSFQWIFRIDFLYDWLAWSPCSPRDSQESSPAPVWKHQFLYSAFFMGQLLHRFMTSGKKYSFDYIYLCQQSNVFAF